ncbi:DinB family protein [Camelliibacillus cellulosilyticus]|uniref:DinB family protein n=1 Tax=Camelliibacillus cellulosilyticus TaxID=2174486 RepID=A0ABV9GP37_9BACL
METTKDKLLKDFIDLVPFLESLRGLDEEKWTAAIQEGKCTIRDIIAHMAEWDRYFLEGAVQKILSNAPLTIEELDFDTFNQKAAEYGKTKTKDALLDQSIFYRRELVRGLRQIPEDRFDHTFPTPAEAFVVSQYIKDFVWHDHHHQQQILTFLKRP